jgi:S1-C subfamily serine protease
MERLYLRDQAAREGWDRERIRNEMQLLESTEDDLRERLGESAYDAYLYASGQTNRVAVSSLLESAQAGQAGIKPGDHIIRYDSQPIYNWRELRSATTSGNIGDSVEVEVDRDGETLQFYLMRGPLGIRMDALRVAP